MSHKHLSMFCFVILFLTACGTAVPTPQVTVTSEVTVTLTPAATPTFIPTATVTPAPAFSPEVEAIIADEKTLDEVSAFLTVAKEAGFAATVENDRVKIEGDIYIDQITGKTERTYPFTLPDGKVIQLTTKGQVGVDVTIGVDASGNTIVITEAHKYTKEAGWTRAKTLMPDGITETEHPTLSKDEFEVVVLAETLKVTEPNWQDPNSATRKESKQRSDELTDGKGKPRRMYEGVEYFVGGGTASSRIYIVDENGVPVRDENGKVVERPSVFYTSLNMPQTDQTLTALEINGEATEFVVDSVIKEYSDYKRDGVASWVMTQAEYDTVMNALTAAN